MNNIKPIFKQMIKYGRLLTACLMVLLIAFQYSRTVLAATNTVSFTDPNIKYVGRWETPTGGASTNSYWGGSYLTVNFTGTTVKVMLAKATSFVVQIDNGFYIRYDNQKAGTIDLTPKPLAKGTHKLKVIAKFETDELQFKGLVLDPGCKTKAVTRKKLIEFIGDSITAGYRAGRRGAVYESVTDYAWLTGESLGCDHTQIAYSGITLVTGYNYANHSPMGMEDAYFKLKPINYTNTTDTNYCSDWDFNKYNADAVVINLGTNDSYVNPQVPSSTFESKYTDFLTKIRGKYPNAQIFVMETFAGLLAKETQAAVNARIDAGDSKVHYIDTTGWLTSRDYVDGTHPKTSGHVKITQKLLPILIPYLK